MAFVFLEPIRDMLDADGLILHRDGFFDRDDMHADTGSSHRYAGSDFLQREESHALEKHGQFRMSVHQIRIHVGVFGGAGDEHRDPVDAVFALISRAGDGTVIRVFVAIVILEHAEIGKLVEQFVERGVVRGIVLLGVPLMEGLIRMVLTDLEEILRKHIQQEIQGSFAGHGVHLIFEDAGEAPVFRGVRVHLDLAGDAVSDVADEFQEFRVRVLVSLVLRDEFGRHFRHIAVWSSMLMILPA